MDILDDMGVSKLSANVFFKSLFEGLFKILINTIIVNKYKLDQTQPLTLFPSSQRVTMTIMDDFCSQIIRQKSSIVSSLGPGKQKWKYSYYLNLRSLFHLIILIVGVVNFPAF